MKWILIFVGLAWNAESQYLTVHSEPMGQYDTMESCFQGRDHMLVQMGSQDGFPLVDTQLVCIRTQNPSAGSKRN